MASQVRKPCRITKRREKWTSEEHCKFLEGIELHRHNWRQIEKHVDTRTAVQIRTTLKSSSRRNAYVSCNSQIQVTPEKCTSKRIDIPPPRPKKKPHHPYHGKPAGASAESFPCMSSSLVSPGEDCSEALIWPVSSQQLQGCVMRHSPNTITHSMNFSLFYPENKFYTISESSVGGEEGLFPLPQESAYAYNPFSTVNIQRFDVFRGR